MLMVLEINNKGAMARVILKQKLLFLKIKIPYTQIINKYVLINIPLKTKIITNKNPFYFYAF